MASVIPTSVLVARSERMCLRKLLMACRFFPMVQIATITGAIYYMKNSFTYRFVPNF